MGVIGCVRDSDQSFCDWLNALTLVHREGMVVNCETSDKFYFSNSQTRVL